MYITWNHMSYWPRNTLSFSIHFSRNWIRQMHKCWTWKTMVFNWSTCTTWNSLWWMLEKWNLYMGTLYSWWKWWKLYPTITYSNYYYSLAKSYNLIFYSTYYRYLILFWEMMDIKNFFYFINIYFNYTTEKLDPEKCYTNIGGFPGMSAPCKFPFTYKGNEYHKCIKKDWDNHWCELDMNHSASHKGHTYKISHESHKWGNCMAGKSCRFGEC